MSVSAKAVKELRESTGVGMLDCKNALEATNGDLDKAIDYLREKGLGKAAKKMDRLASEGLVFSLVSDDFKKSTLVEINSETDFVAKTDGFIKLIKDVATLIQENNPKDVEALSSLKLDGDDFDEYLKLNIARIGEKIVIRRFVNIICGNDEVTNAYTHVNGKVGVVLKAKSSCDANEHKVDETLKNISMHAAAMAPRFLKGDDISEKELEKESNFAKEELKKLNKPQQIWDKIISGKIAKYKNDNTLLGQDYVMDNKFKVAKFIEDFAKKANISLKIIEYSRYELGEGLEKKSENFAEEVAEQLK